MQNLGQILFVMWRETVEAMLVVGILHAWLAHDPAAKSGKVYLWSGVAAGVAGAVLLGLGIEAANSLLGDEGKEYFRAALLLVAAALIVQMVFWMRQHGHRLKQSMETSLTKTARNQNWWGVFVLSAIAVAREGSETVVFLSGLATGADGIRSLHFWLAVLLGTALAAATFFLLQFGGRRISWRNFFRVTEVLLLLLGASLLISGVETLISVQVIPTLVNQIWDTSGLIDDGSVAGGFVSAFTGYRSRPDLMTFLIFGGYWLLIGVGMGRLKSTRQR